MAPQLRAQRRLPDEERGRPEQQVAAPAPAAPAVQAILALQRSAGNAAVARALLQRQPAGATVAPDAPVGTPAGATPDLDPGPEHRSEVELLQQKLNYHRGSARVELLLVDGQFGNKTLAAVVAFKRARGIKPPTGHVHAETWEWLAKPPVSGKARAGTAAPDYAQMFEDGLLEVTIARGFDEHGNMETEAAQILQGLTQVRGFREDPKKAAELRAAAGRPAAAGDGQWLVKEAFGMSADKPVHCVIRMVTPTGGGAGARKAALEGMDQSDLFMYGGHARYGTGPDFDRNYDFIVHWDKLAKPPKGKSGTETLDSVEELLKAPLGISGSEAQKIARFEQLRKDGVVELVSESAGNIGINPAPMSHVKDFGAHLMRLAVEGQETPVESTVKESHYRLWLFNGCSTKDYVKSIQTSSKANPKLGAGQLGMHVTDDVIPSGESAEALLTYLDGVMAQESAAALQQRLELAGEPNPYSSHGF